MDGIVAVNELVDSSKISKKNYFNFKVKFEKAYDYVS